MKALWRALGYTRHRVMLGVVGEWPLDPDFCRVIFAHSGPPIYSTRHSTLHRQLPSRRQRTARKEKRGEGVFAFCLFSSSSSFLHSSFLIPLFLSLFILRFHSSPEFFYMLRLIPQFLYAGAVKICLFTYVCFPVSLLFVFVLSL